VNKEPLGYMMGSIVVWNVRFNVDQKDRRWCRSKQKKR